MKCVCCLEEAKYSILLVEGEYGNRNINIARYYIPNQIVREEATKGHNIINEVWFCHKCMRSIEDNLRATIINLKVENNLININENVKPEN